MYRKRIGLPTVTIATILFGCELLSSESQSVVLPSTRPPYLSRLAISKIELEYPDERGGVIRTPVDGLESYAIPLPKEHVVPVALHYYFVDLPGVEIASGGFRSNRPIVRMRWEEGQLASFLLHVSARGQNIQWFDLERLRSAAADTVTKAGGKLDIEALAAAFQYFALNRQVVRNAPMSEIRLPEGLWIFVDPIHRRGLRIDTSSIPLQIAPGYHGLFSGERFAVLFVGRDEWVLSINGNPETAQFGSL